MRIATDKAYEVQATDSLDFVTEDVARMLNALREVNAEKRQTIRVMYDIEVKDA